jgi:hypothetical protein
LERIEKTEFLFVIAKFLGEFEHIKRSRQAVAEAAENTIHVARVAKVLKPNHA